MITKKFILKELRRTEEKEQVKILYAIESGSRGWGFESKDSDYDVRFIYAHPFKWYLSIEDKRDVIEYPILNSLDLSGWDIKKALKLFKNSNPPLYEWLNSPIIYLEKSNFAQKLRDLIPKFYSPTSCLHHYLSMAKSNYKTYLTGKKVKIKKYFYVLRPIFACMWIEKHKLMPKVKFEELFKAQILNPKLTDLIQQLIDRKRTGEELNLEDKIETIDDFLEKKIGYFEDYAKIFKAEKPKEGDSLDRLFQKTLGVSLAR